MKHSSDNAAHAGSIILHGAHKRWVYGLISGVWLSGTVWLYLRYFAQQDGDFGPVPHAAQYPSLQLHGILAYGVLIAFGSLWFGHIRRAWHLGRNHRSGAAMLLVLLVLIVSALLLYYGPGDEVRSAISWLHSGLGLLLMPLWLAHVISGRRQRKR